MKYPPYQAKPTDRLHYEIHTEPDFETNKHYVAVQFEPVFKHNNKALGFTGFYSATSIGYFDSIKAAETAIDNILN